MDKLIYGMRPVNGTAASVTGQAGCAKSDELTDEQLRENLVAKFKSVQQEIVTLPKKSERRKELAHQSYLLGKAIREIRPKQKLPEVVQFFIDSARDILPKHKFYEIMDEAAKRAREAEGK